MKAKKISLGAIILACVWIGVLSLLKGFTPIIWAGKIFGLSITEILTTGAAFVIVCTPIYRSIWLDKKLGIKNDAAADGETETRDTSGAPAAPAGGV